MPRPSSKPSWLRVRAPGGERYHEVRKTLRELGLNTVCEQARCPNVGTCWREGTATVMLLGARCTRRCRFCAVGPGKPAGVVDTEEPARVAEAVARLGLRYVVLTMVTRDDLGDGGASIVAETIRRLRALRPELLIEALVSDFGGRRAAVEAVVDAAPQVLAHNVEVVRAWTERVRDSRCSYTQSLAVLEWVKAAAPARPTKSSLMVGVGETDAEVLETLRDLRTVGVDLLTLGQYLRPTTGHLEVARFVAPAEFERYRQQALELGFSFVASGPLVRSSYRAAELYLERSLRGPEELGSPDHGAAAPTARP
jgi:lipoic acid synthetase